ncbi:nucleoside-diphosphate sugar epimerase [marine bacterium AO1-C]|nr:nucleoside-diphosphate sugar epimerase [marine bacterium AO1-C]
MKSKKVLLTGITGFVGSHTAIQLLDKGYEVIGTLRNQQRQASIEQVIQKHTTQTDLLSFVEIDLGAPLEKWQTALQGIDYVLHIASPFPTKLPKNENDLILPAKNGTLNILKAATHNRVKRVVMTSSTGAAAYGKKKIAEFTEKDWTNIHNKKDTTPYFRSKTVAEKAAWDYVNSTANAPELVTILPGAILGPVLEKDFGNSANIVKKMLDGSMPALPKIGFEIVDVRSVADAHIKALETPQAAGNRYLCTNGFLEFKEVAQILKANYPKRKIPQKVLPNFMVRLFSNIDPETKPVLLELGTRRTVNHRKIKEELQWNPISVKQSVLDCADSLIGLAVV